LFVSGVVKITGAFLGGRDWLHPSRVCAFCADSASLGRGCVLSDLLHIFHACPFLSQMSRKIQFIPLAQNGKIKSGVNLAPGLNESVNK